VAISRADLLDMLEPGLMHLFHGGCPTSKEQAKREGAKSYYDNRRCRNGHYAMKKLNGHCERCSRKRKIKGEKHDQLHGWEKSPELLETGDEIHRARA
jgi:hypothetical protein